MNENTLTTTEAAELLKVSVSRIEQHCRGGRLGQTFGKFGGSWQITRAEIRTFKAIGKLPPGAKKKGTK
tara:strand:- start:438 stop:644 length:207 start_codon:yes stop_codon:yes gene_type:complete